MVYTIMVFAGRKASISHEEFMNRYEKHMHLVEEICGDAMPLKHTRYYPQHGGPDDRPLLMAGDPDQMPYDVIATIEFEDEAAGGRFTGALTTKEAAAKIDEDEAGFWDRTNMQVFVVGDVKVWKK